MAQNDIDNYTNHIEPATEADLAAWKREFNDPAFLRWLDADLIKQRIGNLNDPQGQIQPEHDLWLAVVQRAIDDATTNCYIEAKVDHCADCHQAEISCSCRECWFTERQITKRNRTGRLPEYWTVKWPIWTNNPPWRPAERKWGRFVENNCLKMAPGVWRYRTLFVECPGQHDTATCARRWFDGDGFEDACQMLGWNVSYARRKMKELLG